MSEPIFDAIIENRHRIDKLSEKIDKLLPEVRDVTKCIVSMRESMSCANPANHGREGKMPRKQPKKKTVADGLGNLEAERAIMKHKVNTS